MARYGTGVYGVGTYGGGSSEPPTPPPMQALRVVPPGPLLRAVLPVLVTSPSGQWTYLDQVGRVSGPSLSWSYPGGPMVADWTLDAPAGVQIPALRQGSTVQVHRGASLIWAGRVSGIDRGTPWRITADGIGSLAVHEPAPAQGSLDSIVDAAIANGLPWTRPSRLSSRSWRGGDGSQDVGTTMLDQVLTDVLLQEGKRWTVSPSGVVTAVTDPTTPALIVRTDTMPPLTLAGYASEVTVTYLTSAGSYGTRRVVNSDVANRFGRVAATLDMSSSMLSSSDAAAVGQAWLARHAPSMTLAGDLTITRGQAITASGGSVDLPLVRPGQVMRLAVLPLWRDALLVPTNAIDVLIGRTRYNADDGTLTLSPINRAPSPGEVILGGAAA